MSTKHTPGPWGSPQYMCSDEEAQKTRDVLKREPPPARTNEGQRYVMSGAVGADNYKRVALVDCQTAYKRGKGYETACAERDANASLIAAAPDLLAALKELVQKRLEKASSPAEADGSDGRYARARAAIAKATGEP